MAEENTTQLAISLPRYDGPFDLLLSLIRRNEYPRLLSPRQSQTIDTPPNSGVN